MDTFDFDPQLTAAALASGMTMAQIEQRDRDADRVRARDRLFHTPPELVTDADILAAGWTVAEWRDVETAEIVEFPGQRDPRGRKPVPTAAVDIAKSLHAQNASLRAISKALAAAGHLSPSGKPYLAGSVRKMVERIAATTR